MQVFVTYSAFFEDQLNFSVDRDVGEAVISGTSEIAASIIFGGNIARYGSR